MAENYNEAAEQAWPSFTDILASTVVVLAFAILVLVIVLSVTRITSSNAKESNDSSPTSIKVESIVLGEFRSEFQKLLIVSNPSLRKEMDIESDQPTTMEKTEDIRPFVPLDVPVVPAKEKIKEIGDSKRQVLGDIPKTVDTKTLEVLKELIIVQKDVIEEQRKVIEQQNEEVQQTVREYQSLLSLITKEKEIEDVRQKIYKKDQQAQFVPLDKEGEKLTGSAESPNGTANYILNPTNNSNISVEVRNTQDGVLIDFKDNAAFLNNSNYEIARNSLKENIESYKSKGATIEAKVSSFALSGAEAQRIAVERMLVFRSILVELGLAPSLIKLKTIVVDDNEEEKLDNVEEESYGWISVK